MSAQLMLNWRAVVLTIFTLARMTKSKYRHRSKLSLHSFPVGGFTEGSVHDFLLLYVVFCSGKENSW